MSKKWMSVVCLLSLMVLGMKWHEVFKGLTVDDFQTQQNQTSPTLSSTLIDEHQWQSYNHWQCFYSDEIEALCLDNCVDDQCTQLSGTKDPMLSVMHGKHLIEFLVETPLPLRKKCDDTLRDWSTLMDHEEGVCIYAAHLQDDKVSPEDFYDSRSVWVLDRMKTEKGVWSVDGKYGDADEEHE